MDKASIIKDAIDYIQDLHEQEKKIKREITELEREIQTGNQKKTPKRDMAQESWPCSKIIKKKRTDEFVRATPVEVLDVSILLLAFRDREGEKKKKKS